jgi:hypothetical protein
VFVVIDACAVVNVGDSTSVDEALLQGYVEDVCALPDGLSISTWVNLPPAQTGITSKFFSLSNRSAL